jgi:hypothetical protein
MLLLFLLLLLLFITSVHITKLSATGGRADNGGEKRNVLIVSVLLPIIIHLALRSKTQRRI